MEPAGEVVRRFFTGRDGIKWPIWATVDYRFTLWRIERVAHLGQIAQYRRLNFDEIKPPRR
jgi:hypothetical protein